MSLTLFQSHKQRYRGMAPDDPSGKYGQTTEKAEGKRKVSAWIKSQGEAPDSGITGTNTLNCTSDSLYYGKFDLTYTPNSVCDTDSSTHCGVPEFRRVKPEVFRWSLIRQCRYGWPGISTQNFLLDVREHGCFQLEKRVARNPGKTYNSHRLH